MDEEEALEQVEETIAEPVAEEEETIQPISVDDLAIEMGWTPPDKWRGDPDKCKTSHDFVRHTVDINRTLTGRLRGLEDQVGNMARTSAEIAARAVTAEREKVLAERQEAFETGDSDAFNRADAKLDTIKIAPVIPPEVNAFAERNAAWFQKDEEATRWALSRTQELSEKGIGVTRQIAIVEREAKDLFPEFFEEKPKPNPAPLNKPGNRGAAAQVKGFATLPDDVKTAANDYAKRGICSVDEYARIYYEQGAGA
jgi:hypothetical protein